MAQSAPQPTTSPLELLYHSISPTLYPTNTPDNILTIRFPSPIRISSIRIIPGGVETFGEAGVTYPSKWKGKIYLNLSTSNPVNALADIEFEYEGAEHALDYPINMPHGVTTRMIMVQTPAERITLSIYGRRNEVPHHAERNEIGVAIMQRGKLEKEDWAWISSWAGGVPGLLGLLEETTDPFTQDRAIDCLSHLAEMDPAVLKTIVDHPTAISYLLESHSPRSQSLLQKILADPDLISHPNLRNRLPATHPCAPLLGSDPVSARRFAWGNLDLGRAALMSLAEAPARDPGKEVMEIGAGARTNLAGLMDRAESYSKRNDEESIKNLELVLNILDHAMDGLDHVIMGHLARAIPRYTVISNLHGSTRQLKIPIMYSRKVLRSLVLVSSEIIDGQSCFGPANDLAAPYLAHIDPSDPLRTAFQPSLQPSSSSITTPTITSLDDTSDKRRLSRLSAALTSPPSAGSSSILHQVTPSEVLALIAPHLLQTLSTARIPPLGITPTYSNAMGVENQANAWAGKVYSEHEFRSRHLVMSGNDGLGSGLGMGMGGVVGGGGGVSRPASRHVDEYRGG